MSGQQIHNIIQNIISAIITPPPAEPVENYVLQNGNNFTLQDGINLDLN